MPDIEPCPDCGAPLPEEKDEGTCPACGAEYLTAEAVDYPELLTEVTLPIDEQTAILIDGMAASFTSRRPLTAEVIRETRAEVLRYALVGGLECLERMQTTNDEEND